MPHRWRQAAASLSGVFEAQLSLAMALTASVAEIRNVQDAHFEATERELVVAALDDT
jgi:hypothetical protein